MDGRPRPWNGHAQGAGELAVTPQRAVQITKSTALPLAFALGLAGFAVYCDRRVKDAEAAAERASFKIETLQRHADRLERDMLTYREFISWAALLQAKSSTITVPSVPGR